MVETPVPPTFTGNRGLMIEEPLIFEQDMAGRCGVDLPAVPPHQGPARRPAAQGAPSACRASPSPR